MIDYEPRTGFQVHLRPEEHERAIDLFGGQGHIETAMGHPCRQRRIHGTRSMGSLG